MNFKNNILAITSQANEKEFNEGINWYLEARLEAHNISRKTGVDFIKVAGIISALSPACDWDKNKRDALHFCLKTVGYKFSTYGNNVKKAYKILQASSIQSIVKILNGKKTTAFFKNIVDSSDGAVTIDRHIVSIFFDHYQNYNLTPKRYKEIEQEYQEVAKEFNFRPHQLQAINWLTYKRLKEEK